MKKKLCFLLLINWASYAQIRLILTTALHPKHYAIRKQQYLKSFEALKSFGLNDVYIIEGFCKNGPTFLDNYSNNVFYSTVNNPFLRNTGINEFTTLLEGLKYFNFDPEDLIVKLTGRHELISDNLFKLIKNNSAKNFDAFFSYHPKRFIETVGFAMKYKYLVEMCANLNYDLLESEYRALENAVTDYVTIKRQSGDWKIFEVDNIGVKCQLFGSTTLPNAPDKIVLKKTENK